MAAILGNILAAWLLIPQIVKLIRTRDAAGVSATWPAIGLITNFAWTAYLLQAGRWLAAPSTVLMVISYSTVMVLVVRTGRRWKPVVIRGVLLASFLVLVLTSFGWLILGVVLGFSYALQVAPALWTAYRTRMPKGISTFTWAIIGIEALLWGYYGWANDDAPLVVFGTIAIVASLLMILRYVSTRHRWADALSLAQTGTIEFEPPVISAT
jgi:uncharacterized protein with PQ loop repeat